MTMTEFKSERLREHYFRVDHKSGLSIYVFPKKLTTTYAVFSTRYGSVDTRFRLTGDADWITVPDGVAHFLEHKLFDNPDGSDSFERFSALGADANAYTGYNRTAYLFSCTDHFEEALEELLRFVTTPYFTPKTVAKEQGIIGEEIRMYEDDPGERCLQNLLEGLYKANSVRKNICGSAASIASITDRLLYDCYRVFYNLSNMALVVCGDVDAETVLRIADRVLPKEANPVTIEREQPAEPDTAALSLREDYMQLSKPLFAIGIKDPRIPSDPKERIRRDAAMSLLDEILFSRSSPFYSTLFEEGLITPSYSYGYSISDSFAFHCVSGESDRPKEVEERLFSYLAQVAEHGIDEETFLRCRRVLYADEIRGYDSTEEIANDLLSFVFDDAELFEYPDLIASVTKEELEALLCESYRKSYFCLSAVYPLEWKTPKGDQHT